MSNYILKRGFPDNVKLTWYDPFNGYTWEAYEHEIVKAEYAFNRVFCEKGYVSLNTLYYYLNLPLCTKSTNLIWRYEYCGELPWLDFTHERYYTEDREGRHDTGMYVMVPSYQPVYEEDYI